MPLARYALYQQGVQMSVLCRLLRSPRVPDSKADFSPSYTAPTADGRPTWAPLCQTIAQEGRCFVVSGASIILELKLRRTDLCWTAANQYHGPADFPEAYPPVVSGSNGATDEVWCRGGSCIVSPLGEILAGPLWDKEGIIYAEIDIDDTISTKLDFDPVGHYSRSDLFEFSVRSTAA